jgi:hypothetical protein
VRGWELATPRCDGVTVEALTTSGERRPRVVVVDEAWWLIGAAEGAGARFLQRLAKSARKHWCGLTGDGEEVPRRYLKLGLETGVSSSQDRAEHRASIA